MSKDDIQHVTKDDFALDDEAGARTRFLNQLEELARNIRSGKTKIQHALLVFTSDLREEDLPTDMPADKRAKLLAHLDEAGHQEIMAIGPGNDLLDTISQLPEHFSEPLLREHHDECHDDDCVLNDPEVGRLVGPLKSMAKTIGRVGASGNRDALNFLLHSLKDMCRKAGRIHAMEEAINRMTDEDADPEQTGVIAVEGEQGLRLMKALADAGVLPPSVVEKIRADIEANSDPSDGAEIPEGSVLVRGDSKIKH